MSKRLKKKHFAVPLCSLLIFAYAVHYTQGLGARMTAKLLRQHHIQL
jgi:hypothetical protein